MRGWKTKLGAFVLGLAGIMPSLGVFDPAWEEAISTMLTGIGLGLSAWGIGHKIEKQGN